MESFRKSQMEAMGHTVGTIWDGASQATFNSAFPLYDLVYVSNEVTPADLAYKVREAPISVVSESAALTDELGFSTSNGSTQASASITITNNTHPITSGLPLGSCTLGSATYPIVRMGGSTASGATVLSTQAGLNNMVAIETGGTLANSYGGSNTAFGRRVQFPMELSTVNIYTFNADTVTLAAQMTAWALGAKELRGWWKLDETSGATASDATFRVNHGTVYGTTAWTAGVRGGGHLFNYANGDDYLQIPDSPSLQNVQEGSYSLAAWFQPLSTPPGTGSANDSAYALVMKQGLPAGLRYTNANNFVLQHVLSGDVAVSTSSGSTVYAPGKFYHVAGVVDRTAGTLKLYVDGQLQGTQTFTANTAAREYGTMPWRLGIQGPGLASNRWSAHGVLDDARIYNYAITPAEVAQLHGFIGHWKFAEGAGGSAADSTAMANNATLSGGATWATDCSGNAALVTNGSGGIAATNAPFSPPSEGTIAFWMKSPGTQTTLRRLFGAGGNWELRQQPDGTMSFDVGADGAPHFATTVPLTEPERWYHVAATYDMATNAYAVYLDGALHKSGINSLDMVPQAAGSLSFGTRTGSNQYWQGSLRDFRVYNRQLSGNEIAELAGVDAYWKFDEASGSIAADASGQGRTATIVGSPGWAAGKIGNSLQLVGGAYAASAGPAAWPKNVTIAGWANLTGKGPSGAELISLGDYFAIRLDAGGNAGAFFYNGVSWTSIAAPYTAMGVGWRHFAAVFDDDHDAFKLYINGVEEASLSTTASIVYSGLGSSIVIGRHGNGMTGMNFTGKVDDVRVYSRALCPEQIQQVIADGGGIYEGVKILKWVETR